MKNIFEDVKFGDAFVCRNGWRLLFITKDKEKALLLKQGTPKDVLYEYNLSGRLLFDGEDAGADNATIKFKVIPYVTLKVKK